MREQILTFLEKNSRIDPKELAVLLGSDEVTDSRSRDRKNERWQ